VIGVLTVVDEGWRRTLCDGRMGNNHEGSIPFTRSNLTVLNVFKHFRIVHRSLIRNRNTTEGNSSDDFASPCQPIICFESTPAPVRITVLAENTEVRQYGIINGTLEALRSNCAWSMKRARAGMSFTGI
jgi:hypothetical protein